MQMLISEDEIRQGVERLASKLRTGCRHKPPTMVGGLGFHERYRDLPYPAALKAEPAGEDEEPGS